MFLVLHVHHQQIVKLLDGWHYGTHSHQLANRSGEIRANIQGHGGRKIKLCTTTLHYLMQCSNQDNSVQMFSVFDLNLYKRMTYWSIFLLLVAMRLNSILYFHHLTKYIRDSSLSSEMDGSRL